jgi:hypothetical protein
MTLEELYKKKRELLMHCVGMSYRMQEVFRINKEIEEWEKKNQKKLVKELSLKGSEESQDT